MFVSERSVEVAATAQQVWDYLVDFSHLGPLIEAPKHPPLVSELVESQTMRGMGAGRRVLIQDGKGFARDCAIKEWAPPKLLTLACEAPPFEVRFVLLSEANTCRVELHYGNTVEGETLSWLVGLFGYQGELDKHAERILGRLKSSVEKA